MTLPQPATTPQTAVRRPVLPVPTRKVQENLSLNYIKCLCAQASLNLSNWEWDDGLDLTIGSAKKGFCGCPIQNVKFHLQLKSTYSYEVERGSILFRLKREKFADLIGRSVDPQYLVVFLMPRDRFQWLRMHPEWTAIHRSAHYLRMKGVKAFKTTAKYAWVRVPLTNRLTATELINMYKHSWRSLEVQP